MLTPACPGPRGRVVDSAQRRVADDVLHVSRLRLGRNIVEEKEFWLDELVRNVVRMFQAEAHANDVKLAFDPQSPRALLVGDVQRITQILVNLVSNAIKFTRHASVRRVRVTATVAAGPQDSSDSGNSSDPSDPSDPSHPSDPSDPSNTPVSVTPAASAASSTAGTSSPPPELCTLVVSVHDSGIGMTSDEQARLFIPFEQATSKTHSTYGGSGMGLFITKELLRLMGGGIRVDSSPTSGTTFRFTIPVRLAARPPTSASGANLPKSMPTPTPAHHGGPQRRLTVLGTFAGEGRKRIARGSTRNSYHVRGGHTRSATQPAHRSCGR